LWLWGLEIPTLLFLFTEKVIFIVSTDSKIKKLSSIDVPPAFPLTIKYLPFTNDGQELFLTLENAFYDSFEGSKLGLLTREMKGEEGPLAEKWREYVDNILNGKTPLSKNKKGLAGVPIMDGLSDLFSVKREDDISHAKKASHFTSVAFKRLLLSEIETAIDEEKKVSHIALAEKVVSLSPFLSCFCLFLIFPVFFRLRTSS
jgi:nucleosome binding factor SPN SPT16 subunit